MLLPILLIFPWLKRLSVFPATRNFPSGCRRVTIAAKTSLAESSQPRPHNPHADSHLRPPAAEIKCVSRCTMSTPVLFTIAQDITKMNISASVSEADIGQVKDSQPVDFTVDAFPDEVFQGKVIQVRKAPTTTQNVVTYETIITVDNPGTKTFPRDDGGCFHPRRQTRQRLEDPQCRPALHPAGKRGFRADPARETGPQAAAGLRAGKRWRQTPAHNLKGRHHRRRGHGDSRRSHRRHRPSSPQPFRPAQNRGPSGARLRQLHEHGNQQRTRHPAPRSRQDV